MSYKVCTPGSIECDGLPIATTASPYYTTQPIVTTASPTQPLGKFVIQCVND